MNEGGSPLDRWAALCVAAILGAGIPARAASATSSCSGVGSAVTNGAGARGRAWRARGRAGWRSFRTIHEKISNEAAIAPTPAAARASGRTFAGARGEQAPAALVTSSGPSTCEPQRSCSLARSSPCSSSRWRCARPRGTRRASCRASRRARVPKRAEDSCTAGLDAGRAKQLNPGSGHRSSPRRREDARTAALHRGGAGGRPAAARTPRPSEGRPAPPGLRLPRRIASSRMRVGAARRRLGWRRPVSGPSTTRRSRRPSHRAAPSGLSIRLPIQETVRGPDRLAHG